MNIKAMTNQFGRRSLLVAALAGVVGILGTTNVQAQSGEDLKTAEAVLQRYVEVTGGIKKYKALKSMDAKAKVSIPMMQMEGEMEITQDFEENRVYTEMTMAGMGEEKSGTDGETVWKISTMGGGASILEGKEASQMTDQASMERIYNFKEHYKKVELVGKKKIGDQECYELTLTNQHDSESTDFYSVKTGLQVMSKATVTTPQGDIPVETTVSDYREVEGVMVPFKMEQKMGPMSILIEMDEVVANEEIKEETFELPESVAKLAEQMKAKKAKEAAKKKETAKEPAGSGKR